MSKPSISNLEQEFIDDFAFYEDNMQKYEHIIDLGKELADLPEELKVDSALVKGCQSRVWLHAEKQNGNIIFKADSDAFIVRGLVSMLLQVYSNQPLQAVANADFSFISKIGLQQMLSPTRANGLASMIKQMKLYAIALQANK